ncbi:MAG: zinc ribbon domain-containing protein, partial [Chloroflexi bacterium]|nr:zinc ribbon domain-containing protein [Chloroflexota bacterium]
MADCSNCRATLPADAAFCPKCGTPAPSLRAEVAGTAAADEDATRPQPTAAPPSPLPYPAPPPYQPSPGSPSST